MTALIEALPRNSSRTRIQARIVPKIELMTTTISEQITVSFRAEIASGEVTWSQKVLQPPANASLVTAARGSRTIRLR